MQVIRLQLLSQMEVSPLGGRDADADLPLGQGEMCELRGLVDAVALVPDCQQLLPPNQGGQDTPQRPQVR